MKSSILHTLTRAAFVTLATLAIPHARATPGGTLDGATGTIFKVDLEQRCFELLKETEYDPKTDLGRSRFTVHWTDQTRITKVAEATNFAGVMGNVVAEFSGMNDDNAKALKEGRPFVAPVAILLPGETTATGVAADHQKVVGWFTPDAGPAPREGTIEIDGKPVKVSLRRQNARIQFREPLAAADLGKGFWKSTIHGAGTAGSFILESMDVQPLADPRDTDDPKLPRVLVIGDSISMNYHDAAKAALDGVANYHRNEGNSFSTLFGVTNMELWLGDYQQKGLHWDVIQFNHGLHDLKQAYDATTNVFGGYAVPLEDYKKNLEKEIAIMKKTGAKLIWCSTTPVPNDNKGTYARRKGAELEFNRAALEVMQRHPEILVNDLHQVIDTSPVFDNWRKGGDVHFYQSEEQRLLGESVATAVRKALATRADH